MSTQSPSITFLILSLCFVVLSCPAALSQDENSEKPHMRLSRPGTSGPLPPAGQPFTLGVEEGNLGFPELDVGLKNREAQLPVITVAMLANYNLELIVDHSMSMRTMDCPGPLSRWNWCGLQAHDLASQLTPFLPTGLTITPFARQYDVYPHASAQNIAELFDTIGFQLGTRLAEPLSDRLNNYFAQRKKGSKPMLIAVITDGVPVPKYEPQMVVDTLVAATKRMRNPHEVTVVFFQIGGGDRKGKLFLHDLETNLVNYGARYGIVQVISFDRLQQIGLARALVETVQDFAREHTQEPLSNPPSRRDK
jgi:hypothetical protein